MIDVHEGIDDDKLEAITHSLIDTIRTLRDDGMSWKKITKKITRQMKDRQTVPYIIYHSQKCLFPGGCKELAEVVFLYSQGAVFACLKHYKETEGALYEQ